MKGNNRIPLSSQALLLTLPLNQAFLQWPPDDHPQL